MALRTGRGHRPGHRGCGAAAGHVDAISGLKSCREIRTFARAHGATRVRTRELLHNTHCSHVQTVDEMLRDPRFLRRLELASKGHGMYGVSWDICDLAQGRVHPYLKRRPFLRHLRSAGNFIPTAIIKSHSAVWRLVCRSKDDSIHVVVPGQLP